MESSSKWTTMASLPVPFDVETSTTLQSSCRAGGCTSGCTLAGLDRLAGRLAASPAPHLHESAAKGWQPVAAASSKGGHRAQANVGTYRAVCAQVVSNLRVQRGWFVGGYRDHHWHLLCWLLPSVGVGWAGG